MVLLVLGASLLLTGPVAAQSASLANTTGMVEMAPAQGADWHFVSGSERIGKGALIRTYAGSSATLTFYDGSRTAIGPDSNITLSALGGGWGNSLQVELVENQGATTNDVVPLRGSGSFFQVNTPFGMASVHGTSFNVAVNQAGVAL